MTTRYQELLVREDVRQTQNSIKRHGYLVPEVNIDLVSGRDKRTLAPHPAAIEHRASFQASNNRIDADAHKRRLADAPTSYRTRDGYKKVNQSTSNIQMSTALSNFSSAQGLNEKRARKANAVLYEKNVVDKRRSNQAREDQKFNPNQWNYSTEGLWDNLAGAQTSPNQKNRGISGYKYATES